MSKPEGRGKENRTLFFIVLRNEEGPILANIMMPIEQCPLDKLFSVKNYEGYDVVGD